MTVMEATEVLGSTLPRLYSPPLVTGPPGPCGCGCALTEATSYGFEAVRFAEERLGRAPWPWQRWLMIHAGERTALGLPRFRRIIVTVGRQSGKTRTVEDLTLFWMFGEKHPSVLGTSTLTKYAKKPWRSAFDLAVRLLEQEMPENPTRKAIRRAAGEEEWWNGHGSHYAIAASNAEGGRSMSNQRVISDEFAKQYNYDAYGAAYYSMEAFEDAQYWALTTPDPKGEPYRDMRGAALAFIDGKPGDESLGLFEWSAPEDCDPTDPRALAMANPTMNRPGGKSGERLIREARAAVAKGGALLLTLKQEILCIQVEDADAAIDMEAYALCFDPGPIVDRSRVALCFDVATSLQHASLYAAAVQADGRVRVEVVQVWKDYGCVDRAVRELPALVAKVKPRAFGWLPSGPGAAAGPQLAERKTPGALWPPRGVTVEEIRGDLPQVSMGFASLVAAHKLAHNGDELLEENAREAEKAPVGDAWRFGRKGGDADALYAAAGAAFLAQTLPVSSGRMRVILPRK